MLLKGDGVPEDENKAAEMIEKLAENYVDAQCRLAIMFRNGEANKFDQEKAFQILKDIVDIDPHCGKALFNIAEMLHHGYGT